MVALLVLKSLWRMLEPRRRVYFVGLVGLLCVSGIFEMAGMLVIFGFIRGLSSDPESQERRGNVARVLETVFGRTFDDADFATTGGLLVLLVILIKNIQAMVVRYHLSRFLSNLNHRVAQQLFAALLTVPYEEVLRRGGSGLRERLKDTLAVFTECFFALARILADAAVMLMVVALLVFVDPILTLIVALMFGGLGVGIYKVLQTALRRMGQEERIARKDANSFLGDGFDGLVEVRLRDNGNFYLSRYRQALGRRMKVERKRGALRRIPRSSNELLLTSSIVGSVIYMVNSGSNLSEALPVLGVFGFAGLRANAAMSRMNAAFQLLRQKGDRFQEMLEEVSRFAPKVLGSDDVEVVSYLSEERPMPEGRDGRLHERLTLENVTFRYPGSDEAAIRGISLCIERGQFVSFCGPSGGGKSTLVMLLMGLLRPEEGVVRCDDWSVHEHIRAWHNNIGYVGQAAYLSPASVRENVAFGVPEEEIDDGKVWRALELAAAREFVEQLPQKLSTSLHAGGLRLSGGQRQRIIIARALYDDPDIVVFDEATAALDNVTEREITEAAIRLSQDKTVICVAHRLSSIRDSDVLFVLLDGDIVGQGTYDELLATNQVFQELAGAAQAEQYPHSAERAASD